MKKVKDQLKTLSKSLASLSKQVEKIAKQVDKLQPHKATTAAKKTSAKKAEPAKKKAPVKKAAPTKKKASAKSTTMLDTIFNAIKRTRKGATVSQLKERTQLNSRQVSNAIYKLAQRGLIEAKSRGLYLKK